MLLRLRQRSSSAISRGGWALPARDWVRAIVVGDSNSAQANHWPGVVTIGQTARHVNSATLLNYAVGGHNIRTSIPNDLDAALLAEPNANAVIIFGGTNDVTTVPAAGHAQRLIDMQAGVNGMIAACQSYGINRIIIGNCPPWEGFAESSGDPAASQALTDDYNAWLLTLPGVVVLDIYSLVEDQSNADALEPDYARTPANDPTGHWYHWSKDTDGPVGVDPWGQKVVGQFMNQYLQGK